jgi:hypothetical protein
MDVENSPDFYQEKSLISQIKRLGNLEPEKNLIINSG